MVEDMRASPRVGAPYLDGARETSAQQYTVIRQQGAYASMHECALASPRVCVVHLDVSLHKVTLLVLNMQSVEAAEEVTAMNSQTTQLRVPVGDHRGVTL
jgi:hypothetical protein